MLVLCVGLIWLLVERETAGRTELHGVVRHVPTTIGANHHVDRWEIAVKLIINPLPLFCILAKLGHTRNKHVLFRGHPDHVNEPDDLECDPVGPPGTNHNSRDRSFVSSVNKITLPLE